MAVVKKSAMQCALVEAVGTFLLALTVFQARDPLAIGLVLMAALYIGSHAHVPYLNSAVSFGEWFSGSIDLNAFFVTVGGQVVGALGAAALSVQLGGSPVLTSGMATHLMGLTEAITTFVFVSVVMSVLANTERFKHTDIYGLVIGLTATGLIMLGGLFNPAIALGIMLYNGVVASVGVPPTAHIVAYVVVPFVGAMLAVWFHDYIRPAKK
jgi:glycerol uptake facilitator-like aquaporin